MRRTIRGMGLICLFACGDKGGDGDTGIDIDTGTAPTETDADGDGVSVEDGDCDDDDAARYPGNEEICNGLDDDCDNKRDEGFPDTDGDGLKDCLDEEECDGEDNDGDGTIDEGFDADTDGIPDCQEVEECNGIDDDADGEIDEDFDLDEDGYTTCSTIPDCDDTNPEISPGATEIDGDMVDNDCDGLVDETSWRPGDLVISEVMVSPLAVEDFRGEWFEVENTSGRDVVLNGLRVFSDGGTHLIQRVDRVQIDAGARLVLGLSMNPALNGGVPVDYAYNAINLDPSSDTLTIVVDGLILDAVAWDESDEMPSPVGATLSLDSGRIDAIENDVAGNWCEADAPWGEETDLGTPGEENTACGHIDHDGDGLTADAGDCDDSDPDVYPGAPEIDVGIDNDCDGVAASGPIAWADYDTEISSLSSCDTLQLDGSRSYDPDGDALNYAWSLTSVPSESTATTDWIESSTDERPTFTPDEAGDYQFSLTVDDGVFASSPSTLTLTLDEPELSAVDAGPDQSHTDSVVCTSTSCEACGAVVFSLETDVGSHPDVVDFSWSIDDAWLSAGIDDPSADAPYVVVWNVTPTPGETATAVVGVTLQVTDCLDRVTEDTLALTVTCTGEVP